MRAWASNLRVRPTSPVAAAAFTSATARRPRARSRTAATTRRTYGSNNERLSTDVEDADRGDPAPRRRSRLRARARVAGARRAIEKEAFVATLQEVVTLHRYF